MYDLSAVFLVFKLYSDPVWVLKIDFWFILSHVRIDSQFPEFVSGFVNVILI